VSAARVVWSGLRAALGGVVGVAVGWAMIVGWSYGITAILAKAGPVGLALAALAVLGAVRTYGALRDGGRVSAALWGLVVGVAWVCAGFVGLLAFAALWTAAVWGLVAFLPGPLAFVGLIGACYFACVLFDQTPVWRRQR